MKTTHPIFKLQRWLRKESFLKFHKIDRKFAPFVFIIYKKNDCFKREASLSMLDDLRTWTIDEDTV